MDVTHQPVDFLFKFPVLWHLIARRHHDHQQRYLLPVIPVSFQEQLKGQQTFQNSFAVIETVNREYDLVRSGRCTDLPDIRSEEHTSELQSLMRISYAVFCLKK